MAKGRGPGRIESTGMISDFRSQISDSKFDAGVLPKSEIWDLRSEICFVQAEKLHYNAANSDSF